MFTKTRSRENKFIVIATCRRHALGNVICCLLVGVLPSEVAGFITMSAIHSLVPARFLTLTAHLVIVITIFWSRDNNVRACLPLDFSQDEYRSQDTQLVVALSVTLGLFAIELAGFFSGVSMFNSTQSLLCILFHTLCSPCINGNPPLRFCLRPEKEATVRSLDRALVILSLTWLALRSHRETWAHKGPQESAGSLTMGYRIKVK
nr:transmembrane protein 107 isoform X4 [Paramormyrops kingsleyae]